MAQKLLDFTSGINLPEEISQWLKNLTGNDEEFLLTYLKNFRPDQLEKIVEDAYNGYKEAIAKRQAAQAHPAAAPQGPATPARPAAPAQQAAAQVQPAAPARPAAPGMTRRERAIERGLKMKTARRGPAPTEPIWIQFLNFVKELGSGAADWFKGLNATGKIAAATVVLGLVVLVGWMVLIIPEILGDSAPLPAAEAPAELQPGAPAELQPGAPAAEQELGAPAEAQPGPPAAEFQPGEEAAPAPDTVVLPEKPSLLKQLLPWMYEQPWFVREGDDRFDIGYESPKNWTEFKQLFRHLGWWITLFVLFLILRTTRGESEERGQLSDYFIVRRGLMWFVIALFAGDALALIATKTYAWFASGESFVGPITMYIVWAAGGLFAIGSFFGAAFTAPVDLSPLGIGMFLTGSLLKLFVTNPVVELIGSALQLVGFAIHLNEVWRHKERIEALGAVIVAVLLGTLLGGLVPLLIWALKFTTPGETMVNMYPILAWLYKARFIIWYVFTILLGTAIVATAFLSRITPEPETAGAGVLEWLGTVARAADSARLDARLLYLVFMVLPLVFQWL